MRGMSSPLPFAFCLLPFAFSLPFVHNVALLGAVRIREALQHEARRREERGGGVRARFPEQARGRRLLRAAARARGLADALGHTPQEHHRGRVGDDTRGLLPPDGGRLPSRQRAPAVRESNRRRAALTDGRAVAAD